MRTQKNTRKLLSIYALAFAAILSGCGGGGDSSTPSGSPEGRKGGLVMTIQWPDATRMIPNVVDQIKLKLEPQGITGATTVNLPVINRPATGSFVTEVNTGDLLEGTWKITADAVDTDVTPNVTTATNFANVQIVGGQSDASFFIVMNSVVQRFKVSVTQPDVSATPTEYFLSEGPSLTTVIKNAAGQTTTVAPIEPDRMVTVSVSPLGPSDNTLLIPVDNGVGTPELTLDDDDRPNVLMQIGGSTTSDKLTRSYMVTSIAPNTAATLKPSYAESNKSLGLKMDLPVKALALKPAGTSNALIPYDVFVGEAKTGLIVGDPTDTVKFRKITLDGSNLMTLGSPRTYLTKDLPSVLADTYVGVLGTSRLHFNNPSGSDWDNLGFTGILDVAANRGTPYVLQADGKLRTPDQPKPTNTFFEKATLTGATSIAFGPALKADKTVDSARDALYAVYPNKVERRLTDNLGMVADSLNIAGATEVIGDNSFLYVFKAGANPTVQVLQYDGTPIGSALSLNALGTAATHISMARLNNKRFILVSHTNGVAAYLME